VAVLSETRNEWLRRRRLRKKFKAHDTDFKVGDKLILTKALGVGIYSAAFKKGALSRDAYLEFMATTTQLNRVGAELFAS
jgi:selenophosphate synthase